MNTNDHIIKEILLHQSYVTPDDVLKAEEYAKAHDTSLIDYFYTSGLINRNNSDLKGLRGIYRYKRSDGEVVYIGRGEILSRLNSLERKGMGF